jgi:hypothetical protein
MNYESHDPSQEEIEKLESHGFHQKGLPYHNWVFEYSDNGNLHDLSAANLDDLDLIAQKELFIYYLD